jgi:predicted metal-dependent enzyme (double-stranded beta helix superfamily)
VSTFDLDTLIDACRVAIADPTPTAAVRDALTEALQHDVAAALPATRAELVELHASPGLTIMKAVWTPGMTLPPHNHLMWAVIGVYGGTEENHFFRREDLGIATSGGSTLVEGDVAVLGSNVIHAVTNPRAHHFTGAIHIYGGDFMHKPRSVWPGEPPTEQAATGETMRVYFDEANADAAPTSDGG